MNDKERADRLDAILSDRFKRSSPVEEGLMAAAMGKRPLPDAETCRLWAIKLGVPSDQQEKKPDAAIPA